MNEGATLQPTVFINRYPISEKLCIGTIQKNIKMLITFVCPLLRECIYHLLQVNIKNNEYLRVKYILVHSK